MLDRTFYSSKSFGRERCVGGTDHEGGRVACMFHGHSIELAACRWRKIAKKTGERSRKKK